MKYLFNQEEYDEFMRLREWARESEENELSNWNTFRAMLPDVHLKSGQTIEFAAPEMNLNADQPLFVPARTSVPAFCETHGVWESGTFDGKVFKYACGVCELGRKLNSGFKMDPSHRQCNSCQTIAKAGDQGVMYEVYGHAGRWFCRFCNKYGDVEKALRDSSHNGVLNGEYLGA